MGKGLTDEQKASFAAENEKRSLGAYAKQFAVRNNAALFKEHIATGFEELDKVLNGGFTPGLHCIGAISSLGKSTISQQMAENMSARGVPVIIFSLEMKLLDLTAKAVSRRTYIDNAALGRHLEKTSSMLVSKSCAEAFSDAEWSAIEKASEEVSSMSENLTVVECGADTWSIDRIGKYVQDWIQVYQKKPFVVIDYLQIIDPPKHLSSASDKQIADYNIKRLKVLADYFDIPILLISSFNRENYDLEVSFKAFKESGNIEYSCDTILGMQLTGAGESGFDAEKAKAEYPRRVSLKVLKQRYGAIGDVIKMNFYTSYNFFAEETAWQPCPPSMQPQEEKKKSVKRL